ncbi:LysR family transcriptional regulator [Candidatus Filomicrobium marinum]|uniref:LysR family transcriptional regulator n=1 Tax=Candidatus Filomicrobium marinum TaxID=1608628 RepID=A0A0D6JFK1_9HYPH|nr:LysR substrate-binding domain-containing protein [Candidatus Filomicrobium marinum]CFX20782.1 LysR family transcriptional regulator [Candidatus Filomicrobium marinum]CPR18687.1 LysR family transcriptional regulator [Candidatus Filomicrobium marinum]
MRRLPPLHALRAFEAAARHQHFGRAAEELHLDPTAISHQVRKLEDLLGVSLFHRRPRPLRLTEAGAKLFPVLRDAMDRMAAASEEVRQDTRRPLVISMTMAFAAEWFTPRLARLKSETELDITVHADNRPVDLRAGDVDLAIRSREQRGLDEAWFHLFDDRLIAVGTKSFLSQHGHPNRPEDLLRVPLIHYRWTLDHRQSLGWKRWFAEAGCAPGDLSSAGDFSEESVAIQAAVSGLGVALLSECLVADHIGQGDLVRVSEHSLAMPAFWAVRLKDHRRASELDLMISRMKASLGSD